MMVKGETVRGRERVKVTSLWLEICAIQPKTLLLLLLLLLLVLLLVSAVERRCVTSIVSEERQAYGKTKTTESLTSKGSSPRVQEKVSPVGNPGVLSVGSDVTEGCGSEQM
jgi:Na+-transporting methylmalonyl-CoA/oxaloacetate decarboxylase gamma subunit